MERASERAYIELAHERVRVPKEEERSAISEPSSSTRSVERDSRVPEKARKDIQKLGGGVSKNEGVALTVPADILFVVGVTEEVRELRKGGRR